MKIWTGIGARYRLPEGHSDIQKGIGQEMCKRGWKLFTGGAIGSDYNYLSGVCAQSRGSGAINALVIRYVGGGEGRIPTGSPVPIGVMSENEYEFAIDYYFRHGIFEEKSFKKMSHHPRYLHARNFYQVMNSLGNPLSQLVVYSARENSFRCIEGGTRTAVAVARVEGVQTFNTYKPAQLRALNRFIKRI